MMKGIEMNSTMVLVSSSTIVELIEGQKMILERLTTIDSKEKINEYITAQEFMDNCRMSRSTFDELRQKNEINVIKRNRKLYLKADAVRKYIEGK